MALPLAEVEVLGDERAGLHATLIGGALMAFLAFLVAWLVREVPLRGWEPDAPAPDPATVE